MHQLEHEILSETQGLRIRQASTVDETKTSLLSCLFYEKSEHISFTASLFFRKYRYVSPQTRGMHAYRKCHDPKFHSPKNNEKGGAGTESTVVSSRNKIKDAWKIRPFSSRRRTRVKDSEWKLAEYLVREKDNAGGHRRWTYYHQQIM